MRISPGPVLVREIDRRVSHAKVYGSSRLVRCVNGVFVLGDVGFFRWVAIGQVECWSDCFGAIFV